MAVTLHLPRLQLDLEGTDPGGGNVFLEGSEGALRIRLIERAGTAVDTADVTDVRWTLYNKDTAAFINSRSGVKASQTYSIGIPIANDTITIAGLAFTFKASAAAAREVTIGSADVTGANLAASINLYHPLVTAAYDSGSDTLTVTARQHGVNGNSITTAESATNITVGGATLAGGTDGVDTGTNSEDHRVGLLAADNAIISGSLAEGAVEKHVIRVIATFVSGLNDLDGNAINTVTNEIEFYVRKARAAAAP